MTSDDDTQNDTVEPAETGEEKSAKPEADTGSPPSTGCRQLSVSVRGLVVAIVIAALVAGIGVFAWLYVDARSELQQQRQAVADNARAEQIALDYATNAAAMNFKDIATWKSKLVAGTTQELSGRLSEAADQMEQILVPLQWDSTAKPLAAKVRSSAGSTYTVDAFVSVMTKTAQGPDPLQSTATYSVTIDRNQNWQITDVGGIGAAVQGR
ncbi:MAG: hypothetical protein AB1925_13090 [Actinomycetota bacterium]